MARSIRLEFDGAFYHVMAWGNRRSAIFLDEQDRRFFLQCVADACGKTGWKVHAWVLMDNHYHLFIQTPEANLVEGMKWLQNTVTRRFNVRHRQWGRLFGDRYKAVVVDGESAYYYETLWDYIHLNPCRAGLVDVKQGQSVLDYPWSSLAGGYALMPHQRAKWLAAEQGLAAMGVEDTVEGRKKLVERLDKRAAEEREQSGWVALDADADKRGSHLLRGWYWGKQGFAEKLMKVGEAAIGRNLKARSYDASPERQAHGQQKALELLDEGLRAGGFSKEELAAHRCTEPRKVLLAGLLWRKTTVSQTWIAEHLGMKNAANVSRVVHRMDAARLEAKVPRELWQFFVVKTKENEPEPQVSSFFKMRSIHDIPYLSKGSVRQALDLYLPDQAHGVLPAILWIHGGAWECGDKYPCPVREFAERGYVVASIGYRLSDEAAFPGQLQDCKSAVRWLRAHADEYGIDPARIGVWGASAGGHLAALMGVAGRIREFDAGDHLDQSSEVQCVVNWFGPVDFFDWGAPYSPSVDSPESPLYRLLGGPFSQNLEKARSACPLHYVHGHSAPFFNVHGDRDNIVPLVQSLRLHTALRDAGVDSTLQVIPGAGHGTAEFILPERLDEIDDFLSRHLGQNDGTFLQ